MADIDLDELERLAKAATPGALPCRIFLDYKRRCRGFHFQSAFQGLSWARYCARIEQYELYSLHAPLHHACPD